MRTAPVIVLAVAGLLLAACSGGSSPASTATTAPGSAASAAADTPGSSPPARVATETPANATPVSPGDTVDVTGVVGTITTDPRVIEITRLSGADVNRIEVPDTADIRSAGGGRIDFSGIRTSDRIIADGQISDRGDALVATSITVSAVVPGAQPGG